MKAVAIGLVLALSSTTGFAEDNRPSAADSGSSPTGSTESVTTGQGREQLAKPPGNAGNPSRPGAQGASQNYNDLDGSSSDVVASGGAGSDSNRGNNH